MKIICPSLLSLMTAGGLVAAPVDFVRDVRPIFEKHCYECHGEKKQKSGLRLDIKAEALRGGDENAPDIIAGKAKESPLIRMVTSEGEGRADAAEGRTFVGGGRSRP
ncbi:MAG: hypothetical protein M3463_07460 [Verrucomicrobiota bacterium]|nr:hypothetical protein [Verrucomicrobiota bacterium]